MLNKVNKYNTDFVDFKITMQEKSLFHWILKIRYFANSKLAKFKSHWLFELCGFPNDSIYKRIYKTKICELLTHEIVSFGLGR